MKIIQTKTDLVVPVERGRRQMNLQAALSYVMHEVEVESGRQAGAFGTVQDLPVHPRAFDGAHTRSGTMLIPFIGGLGDAVCMHPVLMEITRRHPELEIDIATTPGPAEVFELFPMLRTVTRYPIELKDWSRYDHYLSMEAVHTTHQAPGKSLPHVFAKAVGLTLDTSIIRIEIAESTRWLHPHLARHDGPRVGFAVGEGRSLRAYPLSLLSQVVDQLSNQGVLCVLLGQADPDWRFEQNREMLIDLRSKTATVKELGACLNHLDIVMTHDSFIMHLAGALQRPTLGLFSPTSRSHADPYPSVQTVMSEVPCAPCHVVGDSCPKGFARCVAWEDPVFDPDTLTTRVLHMLEEASPSRMCHISRADPVA